MLAVCPAVLISAPAAEQGKTTVTVALALRASYSHTWLAPSPAAAVALLLPEALS